MRVNINLTAYLQTPLELGKTLILFDEVQECLAVRSAIKFLVEDGRFDYIESGSLLGVRYKEVKSYPVGFEQILPMYPLDFEEYLWANGVQDKTLQLSEKRNLFKLYMNDVGLLCASCMENIQFDLLMGNVEINMGSILENAFAQNLKSNGFELHYYDSKKIGKLDFVLQKGLHTELVEIKSGNDFKKHLAMDHAMKVEQWEFEQSIVFSKSNIEKEADVLYLPWYMILFFMQEKEPEKLIYEIDLSGL
jgi:predicted AAA+ superfamily ATPase